MRHFMAVGTFSRHFYLGDFAEEWSGTLKSGSATGVRLGARESEVLDVGGGLTGDSSLSIAGDASSFEAISARLRLVGGSGLGPIGSIILEASPD